MEHPIRIIPRLDIKGPNLIKGVHLEGLRVLGMPQDFARYYYQNGADELLYVDVVASLYNRNSLASIITKTAAEIFIPLTVGGGIRTIADITAVLRAGADKVSLNTAAIRSPTIIQQAATLFGSSTIAVTIEAIKQSDGQYLVFTDNGREYTGIEVTAWAKQVAQLGAGEIIITSIDREGTGRGFDISLTKMVCDAVTIPVIACGGAGTLNQIVEVIKQTSVAGVGLASIIHYDYIAKHQSQSDTSEGNTDFLASGRSYSKVTPASLLEIKTYLAQSGILCRLPQVTG